MGRKVLAAIREVLYAATFVFVGIAISEWWIK